jgi:acyl carrier protein
MKKTPKGNEGHNLELLRDERCHRLRKYDDEQKNLIDEDKAERGIDSFQVVEGMTAIERWNVIKEKYECQVTEEKENCHPNNQHLESTNICGRHELGEYARHRASGRFSGGHTVSPNRIWEQLVKDKACTPEPFQHRKIYNAPTSSERSHLSTQE